jgi:DmsE family decaheme c-type cytochrome
MGAYARGRCLFTRHGLDNSANLRCRASRFDMLSLLKVVCMDKTLAHWFRMPVVLAVIAAVVFVACTSWALVTFAAPAESENTAATVANADRTADLPQWHGAHAAFYKAETVQASFVPQTAHARAHPVVLAAAWSGPSPHRPFGLTEKKATAPAIEKNRPSVAAADQPAKSDAKKKEEKAEPKHTVDPTPATYVGSAKCVTCHVSQGETFAKTTMGRIFLKNPRSQHEKLGCEACHGPGSVHVAKKGAEDDGAEGIFTFDADSPRSIPERNAKCLTCHENDKRTHWKGSAHETRNLACTSCHQIMDKVSPRHQLIKATEAETCTQCHKDRKAQLWRSSHMPVREGKLTCTSCHNPHGTANEKLLKEATVNETCYTCHADKRGPYLFEHAPARDNCLSCHEPHGSIHEKLLTVSRPRLCQQCHSEKDHPSEPHGPRELFAFNRGCANCHGGMQHGSNSPSGAQLHR